MTRWPVEPLTFSKKNPSRAIPRSTYIHPPSLAKIGQRTSEEIGNKQTDRQTDKQTNAARFIVWCYHVVMLPPPLLVCSECREDLLAAFRSHSQDIGLCPILLHFLCLTSLLWWTNLFMDVSIMRSCCFFVDFVHCRAALSKGGREVIYAWVSSHTRVWNCPVHSTIR